jgi:hypothetical protein
VSATRRTFWAWIAFGVGLVALAFAFLGFAYANRNYAEPRSTAGWTNYVPLDGSSIFSGGGRCYDCVDPTPGTSPEERRSSSPPFRSCSLLAGGRSQRKLTRLLMRNAAQPSDM